MLDIQDTILEGVKLIIPEVHEDYRGLFKEIYKDIYPGEWKQDAVSYTKERHTIRGMHKQKGMSKLVSVLSGSVQDVVVDGRIKSSTYGMYETFILSADNHKQLYIPEGFYHGFLSLEDNVVFHYKMSTTHNPLDEMSINYRSLDIRWASLAKCISQKDDWAPHF